MYQMYHKQKDRTRNSYCYGISMPLYIIEKIDFIRKDIPRSRFLLRIIESSLITDGNSTSNNNESLQHLQVPAQDVAKTRVTAQRQTPLGVMMQSNE